MRYLITGGAGFIGSQFVRQTLASGGAEVVVLDNLSAGSRANLADVASRISLLVGDIADRAVYEQLGSGFDAIVHFAAETHVDRSITGPSAFVVSNVLGTGEVLEYARRTSVPRLLMVSTDEVYGTIDEGSWTEDFPLAPRSPYSASKASADLLSLSYVSTFGMDISITRCTNNYGPYQLPEKLIPHFVSELKAGRTVPVYGDGSNIRDWLHVDDHCRGIRLALDKGKAGRVYNIGGCTELANLELTRMLLAAMGLGEERITYVTDRPGHDKRYSLDWSRAQRELGYEPQVSFESGLASTVQWYLDHPEWVAEARERAHALAGQQAS
ncbi:MAG: dTDP-glucose 4,6-dehydratase [Candidatus Nanopelagicales bacterium]